MQMPILLGSDRKLVPAARTDPALGSDDLITTRADLRRCQCVRIGFMHPGNANSCYRAMHLYHSGKIEHQAVISMGLQAQPPTRHLSIESRRKCWTHHHNKVGIGMIKAGGEHVRISECTDLSFLEILDD